MTSNPFPGADPLLEVQPPPHAPAQCMEVWGGSGPADTAFSRPGLDVWAWSKPLAGGPRHANSGGGDLHLLSSCASGRITRMMLAEVCGAGSQFERIAGELRDLMKQNINTIQQARLVRAMTRRLEDASREGGYASTLISTYFAPTRSLSLCNAGHPPPLLYRSSTREWSQVKQTPLDSADDAVTPGVVAPSEQQHFQTTLDLGDMLLGFSNSLTECRGADGMLLGVAGLLNLVRQIGSDGPAELVRRLTHHLVTDHPSNLAESDATILLCQSSATPVPWRDTLLAPLRLLGSVSDKTRLG